MMQRVKSIFYQIFYRRKTRTESPIVRTYHSTQSGNRLVIHTPFYDVQYTFRTAESAKAAKRHIGTYGINCSMADMRRILRNF